MALLLGVLAWVGIDFSHLDELPARLSVPARGWDVCDAKVLEITVRGQFGTAGWAVYQWFAYSGFYVSLAASLVLVAWWQRVRLARAARDDQCRGWPAWRARWGATLRCVARSAAARALACTLVDFALTPGVLRLADASYQVQIAYARDPGATRASLRQEIDRIKADPETMQQIRAQVEQEIVREAEEDAAMEKAGLPEDDSDADGIMRFRSIPLSVKLTA
jgi:hypothetical protein